MSTIQIADKTTLDNTKTNTTNLLTKGGIKYNATSQKYQTYNTTNSSWVDTEFGGGSTSPTLVIKNELGVLNNKSITVYNTSLDFTSTKSMGALDYLIFEVPMLNEYTVTDGTKSMVCKVDNIGGVICHFAYSIISFSSGTDAQIAYMLSAHYNDIINIFDYWAVGDKRTVSLSAMSAAAVSESHEAQDIEMTIIGFEIDDLVTPIHGHTKAAITIGQVDCLKEKGYMNSASTNSGSWSSSARRIWCNEVYYNALPSNFKSMVKQVNKITAQTFNGTTNQTTADYCWLLAAGEIFDYNRPASSASTSTTGNSNVTEYNALTTYPYYETATNRRKRVNGTFSIWWERSPRSDSSLGFCTVSSDGSPATNYGASNYNGIALAMCL